MNILRRTLLFGIGLFSLSFLVLPAVNGFAAQDESSAVSDTTARSTSTRSTAEISFVYEIQRRTDYLRKKLELDKASAARVQNAVAAHCHESYENFLKTETQAQWNKQFRSKRRAAFETELRSILTPQQYVKFLVVQKKYYKNFPFGGLL